MELNGDRPVPGQGEPLRRRLLVLGAQAGDEASFEELVASYHAPLRYFLRKMLPDEARLDDLLQEVWLAAYRGLPRLGDPAAFTTWLYRIARNRAFSLYR